jgi:hypothetical protein
LTEAVLSMMMNPMTNTTTITSSSLTPIGNTSRQPDTSFIHDHSTTNTISTSLSSTISSTRTMSRTSSSSSSQLLTLTRKDILFFLQSFPVRYALNLQQNPKDIVLHMTLVEDVKLNGGLHYASVHVSTDIPSHHCTCWNNNNNKSHLGKENPSQKQLQQHVALETKMTNDNNIKSITIVSPQTSGLLEFIMSLWEASGCDILDCNMLLSNESMLLVRICNAYDYIK